MNLLAFALHSLQSRWRQWREYLETRTRFFASLRFFAEEFVFRDWPGVLDAMLSRRAPPACQWRANPA
ncbi:MAG: hypothetical protein OXN89_19785 [Bryobacterales bacterium]|nr:hypothetical protein [Bryobacterales bacterium]